MSVHSNTAIKSPEPAISKKTAFTCVQVTRGTQDSACKCLFHKCERALLRKNQSVLYSFGVENDVNLRSIKILRITNILLMTPGIRWKDFETERICQTRVNCRACRRCFSRIRTCKDHLLVGHLPLGDSKGTIDVSVLAAIFPFCLLGQIPNDSSFP